MVPTVHAERMKFASTVNASLPASVEPIPIVQTCLAALVGLVGKRVDARATISVRQASFVIRSTESASMMWNVEATRIVLQIRNVSRSSVARLTSAEEMPIVRPGNFATQGYGHAYRCPTARWTRIAPTTSDAIKAFANQSFVVKTMTVMAEAPALLDAVCRPSFAMTTVTVPCLN